jgi:excisionase family DNA binding protein
MVAPADRIVVPLTDRLSLSPEEASALTRIGVTSIRVAVASGALVAHKHGTRTIILPDDLKTWLSAMPKIDKKSDKPARGT